MQTLELPSIILAACEVDPLASELENSVVDAPNGRFEMNGLMSTFFHIIRLERDERYEQFNHKSYLQTGLIIIDMLKPTGQMLENYHVW